MWRVIHPGSTFLRDSSFLVTGIQLLKAGPYPILREENVLAAIDHQESRGHRQGGHIGIVEVLIQTGHDLRETDAVSDLFAQLSWERRHPSHGDRCLDTVVQRSQMTSPQATYGQADATDALLVHFRPGHQIIHGSD